MNHDEPAPFPGTYPGTIQAPPDLPALIARSDLVCLGEVTAVSGEGEVTYRVGDDPVAFARRVASVAPRRVYAGAASESDIRVEYLESPFSSTLAVLAEGDRAVLFLRRTGDRYALTDPVTGKIELDSVEPVAVEGPAVTAREELRGLLREVREHPDPRVARIAGELLDTMS